MDPAKKKQIFIYFGFPHIFYNFEKVVLLNPCLPITYLFNVWEGSMECGGIFWGGSTTQWPSVASGEGGSHSCSTFWGILMLQNEPRCRGKPGEGVPTVATPKRLPDQARMPGCYPDPYQSPIPAIYPYWECLVGLGKRFHPPLQKD